MHRKMETTFRYTDYNLPSLVKPSLNDFASETENLSQQLNKKQNDIITTFK